MSSMVFTTAHILSQRDKFTREISFPVIQKRKLTVLNLLTTTTHMLISHSLIQLMFLESLGCICQIQNQVSLTQKHLFLTTAQCSCSRLGPEREYFFFFEKENIFPSFLLSFLLLPLEFSCDLKNKSCSIEIKI